MAIVWALGAAFGFGIADYIAREAGRQEGSSRALLYLYVVGTPTAALLVLSSKAVSWERVFSPTGLAAVFISMVGTSGALLLYRSLVKGPLLIVSPIASSFAAITAALSLLSGERPGVVQTVGMGVTLAGVLLAAATSGDVRRQEDSGALRLDWASSGVVAAIGSSLLFGVSVWLQHFVVPVLGSQATVLVMRVGSLGFLTTLFVARGDSLQLRSASSLKWLVPIGVLDTSANWFLNLGMLAGLTSVVSVIVSLFSVVTIVLGYFLARERISRIQQVGIVVTLAGVALVSI